MRVFGLSLWFSACVVFAACLVGLTAKADKNSDVAIPADQGTSALDLGTETTDGGTQDLLESVPVSLEIKPRANQEKSNHRSKRRKQKRASKNKAAKQRRKHSDRSGELPATESPNVEARLADTSADDSEQRRGNGPAVSSWVPGFGKRACGKCMWQECQPVDVMRRHCPSGVIRDQCNCCVVCASGSRMPCYLTSFAPMWLPMCGDDLECVPVQGEGEFDMHIEDGAWGARRELEGECSCIERTPVCGSNNQTYDNICEFRELSARWTLHNGDPVVVSHPGPCNTAPKIDRGPEDFVAKVGDVVSFRCETYGFPLPRIQWFKRKGAKKDDFDGVKEDSPEMELPGYLNHAVTQMRGGPGKYQITTWLTLDKVSSSDQGVYSCRMTNANGEVDGSASLKVTGA